MEEQELDIVEFVDEFSMEWLNDKLRNEHVYGGVRDQLIPTKSDDYLLPRNLEKHLEAYLLYMYDKETGGVEPVSSQETYKVIHRNGKEYLQGMFKCMVPVPQASN